MGNISAQTNSRILDKILWPKVRLFNRFQSKDSKFDRFEQLDLCAALIAAITQGWSMVTIINLSQGFTQPAVHKIRNYRWTFSSELSLQMYHQVSEGLNPIGRTIHRSPRCRRHQTNSRAAFKCI